MLQIVLSGPPCCGKTTLADKLKSMFEEEGKKVRVARRMPLRTTKVELEAAGVNVLIIDR